MSTRKPATAESKLRLQDKRLQKKYGITLETRNEMVRQQNHNCKICGGALDAYGPPNVDHYHFHIDVVRVDDPFLTTIGLKWFATSYDELHQPVCRKFAKTQKAAKSSVKDATKEWSVRGLLCFKCNRGLGSIEKFFDAAQHPENLLPVVDYLRGRIKHLTEPQQ